MLPQSIDILIVEDNPNDLELTLSALKEHNIANKITSVTDGAEALDFLFARGKFSGRDINQNPRLVLLDIKLPKINGLEVLKQIRECGQTKNIPVVILTSSKEEQDIITSYKLGVNSYIVKPVGFENFSEAVASLGLYWLLLNQCPA